MNGGINKMSVKSCEKVEKSQVALTIEVGAQEFEAAVEKAYQKMRRKINVPGFRPGKAPRKIIEGMYGAEVFYEEAINIAFPEAYEAAVKEQELQVVGYPAVEVEGQVTKDGFTFKATVPVYPEVKLGQYKGLSAEKEEVKVSASDVDTRLKALADRNTRLVSVDREAKEGDTAVIDFEGFLDGKSFDGGKGENYSLELGSHTFIPGFEEQVVGMKAGDEKDLHVTFPEDYHQDLAGKAVVFKVKVHEVKEKEVPAMDDEFAKDVSEFDTLKDLKADLKKKITAEREDTAKRAFEDALMEQVAEGITADVPDAMVEAQARQFLDNFKMQLAQQGIKYDEYMKAAGMDESKLVEDAKEPALKQVRMDLAMAAIIKEENDFTFELQDRPQCLERICTNIENFIASCGVDRNKMLGLGVCMTGRVNPETGRSYKYFTSSEKSLRDILEERIGLRVLIENDTRARCYAEYTCGKSKDESNVLYLHMGRGVAIGIVVDGKLYYGKSGFAGEFGHIPFFDNEIICSCGKKGCLETEVSGIAIEEKMRHMIEKGVNTILKKQYDEQKAIHIDDIIQAAMNDDNLSIELIEEAGEKVGKAIAFLINTFNPETVIVGGNLAAAGDYLMLPLKSATNKYSLNLVYKDTKFRISKMTESANAWGVAMLIRNKVIGI